MAIVLFVDKKYDPGPCPISFNPPHRLIIANLEDCLKGAGGTPEVLTMLKPLTLPSKEKLTEAADQWIREIDALKLPDEKVKNSARIIRICDFATIFGINLRGDTNDATPDSP